MKKKKLLAVSAISLALASTTLLAEITFRNAITGAPLDMSVAKSGGNEEVFKQFKERVKTHTTATRRPYKKVMIFT